MLLTGDQSIYPEAPRHPWWDLHPFQSPLQPLGLSHAILLAPRRLLQTDIPFFPIFCHIFAWTNQRLVIAFVPITSWLAVLMSSFLGKPWPIRTFYMEETLKKNGESATECFICSSKPLSKNIIYIYLENVRWFARIIRLSLVIDVNKYSRDGNLFVCRQCFQQLTKYERAGQRSFRK